MQGTAAVLQPIDGMTLTHQRLGEYLHPMPRHPRSVIGARRLLSVEFLLMSASTLSISLRRPASAFPRPGRGRPAGLFAGHHGLRHSVFAGTGGVTPEVQTINARWVQLQGLFEQLFGLVGIAEANGPSRDAIIQGRQAGRPSLAGPWGPGPARFSRSTLAALTLLARPAAGHRPNCW